MTTSILFRKHQMSLRVIIMEQRVRSNGLVVLKDFSLTMALIFANLYLIQPVLTSEELYEHY